MTLTAAHDARGLGDDTGKYRLLSKYLRDRFADRLVLTFAQIKDLLGFTLPATARRQLDWWGDADAAATPSPQSDAWTLAGRTANVNLLAESVTFERGTAYVEQTST